MTWNALLAFPTSALMPYAAKTVPQSKAKVRLPLVKPTSIRATDTYPSPPISPEATAAKYPSVASFTPSLSA